MKKLFALLLAAVMVLSMTACGQKASQTEIITGETTISAVKMEIPTVLQGYKDVHLIGYDGRLAIYRIDRERMVAKDYYQEETARIVVYDIENNRPNHVISLDFPFGTVHNAIKKENDTYFEVSYRQDKKSEIYVNDGFETQKIAEFKDIDFAELDEISENIVCTVNKGQASSFNYDFYTVNGTEINKVGSFVKTGEGFIDIYDYADGVLTLNETEISEDGYIYFNNWAGDKKETVFKLPSEHSHSFWYSGNMFIHPLDNDENNVRHKMMAVTDLNSGAETEIGMMQGGFFADWGNKAIMYQYGQSAEQLVMFEAEENTLTITPVDIDVKGKNNHTIFMTEDSAMLHVSTMGESEYQLYRIEY